MLFKDDDDDGYDNDAFVEDDDASTEEEEEMPSDDEYLSCALPPVPRRKPKVPQRLARGIAPLNPFNVLIQMSLNEVGIVQPHRNSQEAWDKFCDVLAEKVNVMEQIVNYMKTSKDMKQLYATKQRAGTGVVAWKHAFRSYKSQLIPMAQKVLTRDI